MNEAFDIAAITYDDVFTNSHIGKMQRDLVHDFLRKNISKEDSLDILEINCGTGHDAIWLAHQGHNVIATDISSEMISIAENKEFFSQKIPKFRQLDINNLNETHFESSFDIIFSDFGGLNCLSSDQLEFFFTSASKKLKPQGRIIGVIMPKHCLLESLYFIAKGNIKKAFRRNTKQAVSANVDGVLVDTWYYNPKDIKILSQSDFSTDTIKPIGFCIPPSYLESFFKKRIGLLKKLRNLDSFFKDFSSLSRYSDHYIISLSKK
ncbi:class I SAM-dependent methyltransferase [Aquimarina sp. 2201CG5-10]|uniref:class I SAM-dependent methyltransferase n=1 Tax=Aquimarina callyspongiae TaxID=3098150 RepID=UPI002AB48C13|nr:class I SAM-dependent methyltransferase [Aquimarina sp. 2201CG5-10]MDY8138870.1 class I SAM-dependent methyltransferase [Aquimarina sp. 2201CG5-10]